MRITVDLAKASTETLDLTSILNPRVGDGDLKLPFHFMYDNVDYDMRGKSMDFLSEGSDKKKIYVTGTVDDSSEGDDPYTGNVTFTFPTGTFKTPGTYDVDKTMFRVVNNDDHSVISTVNVKMNVLPNDSDVENSDDVSYDSRMEKIMKDYSDKGQASLNDAKQKAQQIIDDATKQATDYLNTTKKQGEDLLNEIKQTNSEAKGNVAGDTAATAKQAKEQANMNAGLLHDQQGEIGDARGRYMKLVDRENAQDDEINRKEDRQNANENYAAIQIKDAAQDRMIATKADQNYIDNYLSHMHTDPVGVKDEATLKAKYPNGANGIFVTSNGHGWIYTDNQWYDFGPYQAAGLATDVKDKLDSLIKRNLIKDSEFNDPGFPEWTATNDIVISAGHSYHGHNSLRVTNSSNSGQIYYTEPIPVAPGDLLSFSVKAAFYSFSENDNVRVELQFYTKSTDRFGEAAAHSETIIWSLNRDNSTEWHEFSKNALTIPDGINYVRIDLKFTEGSASTAAFEIAEPLLVINDRVGTYTLDELPAKLDSLNDNLYPDPNYTSVNNLVRNNLTIIDTDDYMNNHHIILLDATKADPSDTTHPPYMATPVFDVHTTSLSFYTGYAYDSSSSNQQWSVELDFYNAKPSDINATPDIRKTKQITALNASYSYMSFNDIALPGTVHYARVIYRISAGSKLWLMNPIIESLKLHPLPTDELPMAKPRFLHFVNPFYTIGGESRKYIWVKFDKMIVDYYTDEREIIWKDWINKSAGPADDFSEQTWYVDVGPMSTDKNNFLAYNVETNQLEVVNHKDKKHIPVLSWNEEDGFYGSFIDQADQCYRTKSGRSEHNYDRLTTEMLGKLATKENEVIGDFDQNDFVFGLVADNHHGIKGADEPYNDNPDYTGMAYAKVANDINLDANFNLGDSILSDPHNCTAALMNAFRRVPAKDWVYVEGNHDRNIFAPILSKVGYNNIVNRHHLLYDKNFHFGNGENSSYYYVDYDDRKIRVIVLDLYDIGPAHDNVYNDDAGYRQGQLEWLINTALNVEDGWQVLVMTHQPPIPGMPENNLGYNSDALIKILESFKAGTSVEIKKQDEVFHDGTFDLDLHTNFTKPGTIIAVLSGHAHNDFTITQNGINYVQSCCGYIDILLYHSQHGQPAKYGQRDQYTYSAICFDICILNTTNRTLKFKRFGFGKDRQISY